MSLKKLDFLFDKCREGCRMRIAVACPHGMDALGAVCKAHADGLVQGILVGDPDRMRQVALEQDYNLSGLEIVEEKNDYMAAEKAVKMVSSGEADLLMKGLVKTAALLKAVLNKEWGMRTGSLLSHLLLFEIPLMDYRVFALADAGMNMYPDLNAKAGIINNSVECLHKLGLEDPKVAALAAVEAVNPDMPCTLDAAALTQMNRRGQIKGCTVDGPFALDNAVSLDSAKIKGIESPVAGNADLLIVPDIEAGNILAKVVLYMVGARAAGVVLGATRPIVLTSRFDSMETKLASIALGATLAK